MSPDLWFILAVAGAGLVCIWRERAAHRREQDARRVRLYKGELP